jgi:hypothetical protein
LFHNHSIESILLNVLISNAGIDKAHRDMILGHSLQGMDAYYLVADENALKRAMGKYTDWLDRQIEILNSSKQTKEIKF